MKAFWEEKTLAELNTTEWESLCDGCGRCCLHKFEDEDSGEVFFTSVHCHLLDAERCRCKDYSQRRQHVPDCITLNTETLNDPRALPSSCAYRLLAEGHPLPDWHPLVSGDTESVHQAGISVRGKVISETNIDEEDLQDYLLNWPDK